MIIYAIKSLINVYSRFHETFTINFPNFVANFTRLLRSSKVHNDIHKPVRKLRISLASFTSRTNRGLCLQIGLWIPIRASELRNEVRNICGQSFVKSTVKSSPGWGIFHSQLISLQVVSRHPGIYTIITNQIKCPGVFPGGGMVTPGIDSCINSTKYWFWRCTCEGRSSSSEWEYCDAKPYKRKDSPNN